VFVLKSAFMTIVLCSLFLLFVGCTQDIKCEKPYILKGNDCCLDQNEDLICDSDELPSPTPVPTNTPLIPVYTTQADEYDLITGENLIELKYAPRQCVKTKWESAFENKELSVEGDDEVELLVAYYAQKHNINIQAIKRVEQPAEDCRTDCMLCERDHYFLIKADKKYQGKFVEQKWDRVAAPDEEKAPYSLDALRAKLSELRAYEYYDRDLGYVLVAKDKLMVVLPLTLNKERKYNFNHVYFDLENKKAYAFCAMDQKRSGGSKCLSSPANKYFEVDYEQFFPKDIFGHLVDAEDVIQVASKTCENTRQCDVYQYTEGGDTYLFFVRQVSGIPYKVARVEPDGTENVIEIYTNIDFNHLSAADIKIPNTYKLMD